MALFKCEFCQGAYEAPDSAAQTGVVCPHCGESIAAEDVSPARTGNRPSAAQIEAADLLKQRMVSLVPKAGFSKPHAWIVGVATALVCVVGIHAAAAAMSLTLKPLVPMVVFGLPLIGAALIGFSAFGTQARAGADSIPIWITVPALLLVTVTAAVPLVIARGKYDTKARRHLGVMVNTALAPPLLPASVPECEYVTVSGDMKTLASSFGAVLKGGREFPLKGTVNLWRPEITSGVEAMQRTLLTELVEPEVRDIAESYAGLAGREVKAVTLDQMPQDGSGIAKVGMADGLALVVDIEVKPEGVTCRLDDTSHVRASAMPRAAELWMELAPGKPARCSDVALGTLVEPGHWQAEAILDNGKRMPVRLLQAGADARGAVTVLLREEEAAIVAINRALEARRQESGEDAIERCINADTREELRAGEFSLRALFVEDDPLTVLVEERDYVLTVTPEPYHVMLGAQSSRADKGWSLVLPAHYALSHEDEFTVKGESKQDGVRIALASKKTSEYAEFDLGDYAAKERARWAAERQTMKTGDLEMWRTRAGLSGYRYVSQHGKALRGRYAFYSKGHLATITVETVVADDETLDGVDTIIKSLRFADQATDLGR